MFSNLGEWKLATKSYGDVKKGTRTSTDWNAE